GKPAGARGNGGRGGKPAAAGGGRGGNKTGAPAGNKAGGSPGNKAGGSPGNKGPGAGGKPRAPRNASSSPRGDDWQPRGASAHESRLGVMGGRGRQGR
ncbi:MAG: 23S rRNA pseudouridylate synthase B, partial [Achromobacter sp.]